MGMLILSKSLLDSGVLHRIEHAAAGHIVDDALNVGFLDLV